MEVNKRINSSRSLGASFLATLPESESMLSQRMGTSLVVNRLN